MTNSQERLEALKDSLEQRVLVLDGAMGTMIHAAPLSIETDYQGRENCPEILNATRPDVIQEIHRQYLEAGADIIETNTFGGTQIALADNKLADRAYELNFAAAKLAREIADKYAAPGRPRFVAGSMGPTNKDLNITGTTNFEELRADYYLQAKGLMEGGADYLLIETAFDTGSLKAGLAAPVHPHMLRHSFASHVLQSSSDLRAVQELLGHANISTTQIYTRLDFQHLAKAYDAAHPRAQARPEGARAKPRKDDTDK